MISSNKITKNTPKTIQQITSENTEPYLPERGKPPFPPTNRGNDVSMRGEVYNDLTVGIEDINEAVMYYFKEVIKPYVIENGTKVNVPVHYYNPERWKASQADGMYRDQDGKIIFPIIILNRNNIQKVRTIGNKLDGNQVHNYAVFEKRFSKKNQYDNFAVLTNRIPVKEYVTVAIPDYYQMRYTCTVYVSFMQDLDRIIEAIGQYSYSYWGRQGKFKFMAMIDSFDSRTEITQGNDRIIICNFDIVLNGYITPKDINKQMATSDKYLSKAQLIFTAEVQNTTETLNLATKQKRKQASFNIFPEKVTLVQPSSQLNTDTLDYINTSVTKTSGAITIPNQASFASSAILQPPAESGLPATTALNFSFFINGQYVPSTIVTLTEVSGNVVATFNTVALGYEIEADDEITAVGKFA